MLSYLSVNILPIVAFAFGVPTYHQTFLNPRSELPTSSHMIKSNSFKTFKTNYAFSLHLNDGLHTLYAQLRGITLAPPVLPRRLARVFAGASFTTLIRCNKISKGKRLELYVLYLTLLGRALAHCPRFLTAASNLGKGTVSVPMWLNNLTVQLSMLGLVRFITPTT